MDVCKESLCKVLKNFLGLLHRHNLNRSRSSIHIDPNVFRITMQGEIYKGSAYTQVSDVEFLDERRERGVFESKAPRGRVDSQAQTGFQHHVNGAGRPGLWRTRYRIEGWALAFESRESADQF